MSRLGEFFDHVKTAAQHLIGHEDPKLKALGHDLAGKAHAAEQEIVAQAGQLGHDAAAGATAAEHDAAAAARVLASDAKTAAAPLEAQAAHTAGQIAGEGASDVAKDA
jgi:hypothetical protein